MSPAPPSPAPERRVRALRIRAPDADAARRATIALGDALHTAALPDADGGRFVVIRRVELGRIPAHASSATLALLVGRVVRETAQRAVRFDQPGAGAAAAVAFPDRATALVALARRHARHEPAIDWLWEQIVPGWRAAPTRVDRWRVLLETAHTFETPILTAAEIVHHSVQDDSISALLPALSPPLIARWMSIGGWEPLRHETVAAPSSIALSPPTERILQRASLALGSATDPRIVWFGAMLAVRERPARMSIGNLPARIAAGLRAASFEPPTRAPRSNGRETELRTAAAAHPAAASCGASAPATVHATERPSVTRMEKQLAQTSEPIAPTEGVDSVTAIDAPTDAADLLAATDAPSACAGLLFFVHVLRRLGFSTFLAAHPEPIETDFPLRLLYFIGRRAGMTENDPLALTLGERMAEAARGSVSAERDWRCGAWLAAVRGWCRRRGRLDWRAVVRRTGRVRTTRTHLEVFFEPRQADVALRRVALDVDPGWVPWLGCIVRVHYLDTHELSR